MVDKVYCYPDSDVLINKLGIREQEKLCIFERKLTMLRIMELIDNPIKGNFDFKHLQKIHEFIFRKSMLCILFEKAMGVVRENLYDPLQSKTGTSFLFQIFQRKK